MSDNVSKFGIAMMPRILGAFVMITLSWVTLFFLDMKVRDQWLAETSELSERAAIFTKSWLEQKANTLIPLAQDAHIVTALSNGDSANNKQVKKAFYTFGYLNNIPDVYLFSKDSAKHTAKTATAKPLPQDTLNYASMFFSRGDSQVSTLALDSTSRFFHANTIHDATGSYLGYVGYTEDATAGINSLISPLRSILGKFNFSLYYQLPNGFGAMENVNKYKVKPRQILLGKMTLPIFEKNKKTGIFEDARHEKVIASTISIPQHFSWRIAISRPTSEISDEAPMIRRMIIALAIMTSLLILVMGRRETNPILHAVFSLLEKREKSDSEQALTPKKPTGTTIGETVYSSAINIPAEPENRQPYREQSILEKAAHKKMEELPPSEAEVVYTIKTCLRNRQLKFMYQPVIDSITKQPIMYEIYLRMFDEEGKMLQPGLIFPAAHKHGLESAIDECVISTAIERHLKNNRLAKPLAINLTGASFESISFLETLIKNTGAKVVHGNQLVFEVRSREIIEDKRSMKFIKNCHALGCKFSIDYFGGGRSTIEAAKTLKFDYIKIDGLEFNPDTASMKKMNELKEVADACLELGMPLIMEKIETNTLVALCRRLRIPYIQGYKIAKPQNEI